jgi:WD40 repeat protein
MKIIKSVIIGKIFLIFATLFVLVGSINAMKPHLRQGYSGQATSSLIKTSKGRQLGLEDVWVRTSDDKVTSVPLWQIEQMTVLYEELIKQNGKNSQENPLDASFISSGELELLHDALIKVEKGLFVYERGDARELIAAAGRVGAHSLSALLAKALFPQDIQSLMVAEIIKEVVSYIKNPAHGVINLAGHQYFVTCLAFSPNGKFFVSGSLGQSNNLIMWDAGSLQQKNMLSGHSKTVTCVAVSPDSQYIVSGAQQGTNDNLILWNVGTQKFKKLSSRWFLSFVGHTGDVKCVAFSPDGKSFVSGSVGNTNNLIVWDVQTKKQKYALAGHTKNVTCVAFSPDGNYIASGSADKTVMLWDTKTGKRLYVFEGHTGVVMCLAFDCDSTKIISGSAGGENTLFSWDIETKQAKNLIVNRAVGSANCIVFSPEGRYFFVGGGTYLDMWDTHTEKIIHNYVKLGATTALAVSHDSCCFAAGTLSFEKNVIVGNIAEKKVKTFSISRHTTCLAFNPQNSNFLIVGSQGAEEGEYYENTLNCLKVYEPQALEYIETKLTIPQAYFLYRLYKAQINKDIVIIDQRDQDFAVYDTLPLMVKQLITTFFPFQVTFAQSVQEKKKLYKPLFAGLTTQEKIAKIKQIMDAISDKNSVGYKACQELLNEFENEAAFEV